MKIWTIIILLTSLFALCTPSHASFIPDTPEKVNQLANAIFHAEGGKNARYGIKSVPCKDLRECRRVCKNTIRNNVKRWNNSGRKVDYLTFLRHKYAPPSVSNDPSNLNRHWLKNVKWFLNNPKELE